MNMVERAQAFVQRLKTLAWGDSWLWKRCPYCGSTVTIRNGSYRRRPWTREGRQVVRVQRHLCRACERSYAEQPSWLVAGSWYSRGIQRMAIDLWMHGRTSLRRAAEFVRSLAGQQERFHLWHPWEEPSAEERCRLSASTLHRWLDRAGARAAAQVEGQMAGIPCSGLMGTDGLWVRLRGGIKRVVLLLEDSVSGVLWPPMVVEDEERYQSWRAFFQRVQKAGLDLMTLKALSSDGALGLQQCLHWMLILVQQQRCVFHLWRNLGGALARAASLAAGQRMGETAQAMREQTREELTRLIHGVFDAPSLEQAQAALRRLRAQRWGAEIGAFLEEHLDSVLLHLMQGYEGLLRVGPEWRCRDYRLRVSRGRNHGSEQRQERAALTWSLYHNFTPAQRRSERKRRYRHPGQSPLDVAGVAPGPLSYLDALQV